MSETNEARLTRRQLIRSTPAALARGAFAGSLLTPRKARAAGLPLATILAAGQRGRSFGYG